MNEPCAQGCGGLRGRYVKGWESLFEKLKVGNISVEARNMDEKWRQNFEWITKVLWVDMCTIFEIIDAKLKFHNSKLTNGMGHEDDQNFTLLKQNDSTLDESLCDSNCISAIENLVTTIASTSLEQWITYGTVFVRKMLVCKHLCHDEV